MKIFIAGTMQGSGAGYEIVDQSYRGEIRQLVRKRFPKAEIVCPLEIMTAQFRENILRLTELHRSFPTDRAFRPAELGAPLSDVTDMFQNLVRLAGTCDVLIACIPGRAPSMGTAMEMWAAFTAGATVITITDLTQNLAIVSASTIIVPSLAGLRDLFNGPEFMPQSLHE
jgi:hypothetical protein